MDVEDGMASIDDIVGGLEMNFHDDLMKGGASASGAGGVAEDSMMGVFSELNIVGITEVTEVFSPPRVVMQGMKIGLRAGSSMDLLKRWNLDFKADRDRATRQIDEEKRQIYH